MPLLRMTHITRIDLQLNPNTLFLFGDNHARFGASGQSAAMRGEPNACGIRTKYFPDMREESFFRDYMNECYMIGDDFSRAREYVAAGKAVVIPSAGLGTGRAQLQTRAPHAWTYLQQCIAQLDQLSGHAQALLARRGYLPPAAPTAPVPDTPAPVSRYEALPPLP